MTGEPGELYELHLEKPEIELLAEPVLVIALDGYIDAGSGVKLAVDHLLGALEHTVVGGVNFGGRVGCNTPALPPETLHRAHRRFCLQY